MSRTILGILSVVGLVGVFAVSLYPVNNGVVRITFLLLLGGCWLFTALLFRKYHRLFLLLSLFPVVFGLLLFLLPEREMNSVELHKSYVDNLRAMEGVRYYWGGESNGGIDCSGLPRRALRDALLAYGLKNGNNVAIQLFLEQWWFDASARALGNGYRGYTFPVGLSGTINNMDYDALNPGDMAVTQDGVHMLAYLGKEMWIQAEPDIGKVIILHGRNDTNPWFNVPVSIHRWDVFEHNDELSAGTG